MEEPVTGDDFPLVKPYQRLSRVYDLDWANFARQYISLIRPLLDGRGIEKARILDLACGTGGLAIELAGYGHTAHGLDISRQMVALARAKSRDMSSVSFKVQDMACFHTSVKYDLITCTFDSINYLREAASLKEMLRRVAAALEEHGLFIFDSNTRQIYLNHNGESYHRGLGGQFFVHSIHYDSFKKEATTTFEFALLDEGLGISTNTLDIAHQVMG